MLNRIFLVLVLCVILASGCQKDTDLGTNLEAQSNQEMTSGNYSDGDGDCGPEESDYRIRQTIAEAAVINFIKNQHDNTDASWDAFFQSNFGQFHWDAGIVSQRPNFQIASIPVFHDASQTVTGIMRINVNNNSLVYNFLDRGVNDLLMQESPNFVTDQINYLFELFDYAFCSADEIPSFPPFDDGVLTEINDCEFVSETLQTWNWIECVVFDGDHATSTRSCGHWEVGSSETTTWIECDESAGGSSSTGSSTSSGGSGNSGTGSSGTGSTSSSTAAQKTAANYLKSTFYGSLNDHISEIMEYGDLSCKNLLIGAKNLLKDQNSSPNSLLAVRCFLWGISIETNPSAPPSCEQENGPLADIFDSAEAANLTGNALDWSRAFGGLGLCDLISSDLNSSQLTNLGLSMDQFLGSIDPYLVGLSSIGINSEPQYPYYDPPPVATIKMDAVRSVNSLLLQYPSLTMESEDVINMYDLAQDIDNMAMMEELLSLVEQDGYESESLAAMNMTFAVANANLLYGSYDNTFLNLIDPYTEVDLTAPDIDIKWLSHFSANCAILKFDNPEWSDARVYWEASKEMIHLALDIGGLAPVAGEVCDVANGTIYAIEGDGLNASLSFSAAIPILGWYAAGLKAAKKVVTTASGAKTTLKWRVRLDEIITFGRRGQLRKVLGLATGNPNQAHHIMSWGKFEHDVIQKAAKAQSPFHMNDALNGIPVEAWRNTNHPLYDIRLVNRLDEINLSNPSNEQALEAVTDLIDEIRTLIINNPNLKLNDIVF